MNDEVFMSRALALASQGLWSTSPNPRVGCVFVKQGKVIAEGFHQRAGGPHAEVAAINQTKDSLTGATAYVTLEPCSHFGRTPPCCQTLAKLNLERVVVAMTDPNPLVSGRGLSVLKQAGFQVDVGILEEEALQLNRGYIKRMKQQGPWLFGKVAISIDGGMALASGESKWITGDKARQDVMTLRAQSCAILTGVKTVIQDNPLLNVRLDHLDKIPKPMVRQPDLIILDTRLSLPLDARLLTTLDSRNIVVIVGEGLADKKRQQQLSSMGVEVITLPVSTEGVDLNVLQQWLKTTEYNEVMVESGPTLMSQFLQHHLLDELVVYQAPMLMGKGSQMLYQVQTTKLTEAARFTLIDSQVIGDDIRSRYQRKAEPELQP
ncbi:bifunctional diaminohydroxyphosphoribosylaminopyrimidine deaminase/5-amino-6-(5-phosphoribosylamino)uracil reductase RibD [Zooshikella ganghwensis]|uniref:Riboflavin biosynthesis protein RibD n=1 Tax=Zooshikella ganghwensis TaxID=202772 RepID=A0A4V1INE9_9GAMM|nr:bifunctional diaminohydroxyphosphoribosylaminopyrimidine deaminase/5-amino-6-(5-phosphoribosylamino)uracil reductase RibD [Zooshikella ganghwensis]RDH43491.1 bifunctional diaminohydroxyphosphoribosylaminopyrimidine deaminase/5-amino-6-(5-phosphoribosylamino)uracil reductase RibD [Zooshikella ganghwensis]